MKVLLLCLMVRLSWTSPPAPPPKPKNLSCNCGWRNSGRIIRGQETGKNEYPWMAWINRDCGGSIITKYHVLTAAHCTDKYTNIPSALEVSVGKHYRIGVNENMKLHRVSKIIQHGGYKMKGHLHDITILVLATPISFNLYVGPVCLPSHRYDLDGKFVKATGWGYTEGTGDRNPLREVDLKVISNRVCKLMFWRLNKQRTQMCVYTCNKNTCNGDSGGPLVYLDPDTNRYTQVALVSYGKSNCKAFPMASVNTDIYAYIYWIKNATQQVPKENYCKKL